MILGGKGSSTTDPLPNLCYEAFEKIKAETNHELVFVEEAGVIIGTLQLSFLQYLTYQGGLRAPIEAVRVHEEQSGKKIGEQLIRWAIKRSRERGAHLVQLTSDKQREAAIRFYERLGFKTTHEGMKLKF